MSHQPVEASIFISYRQSDSQDATGRIHDQLNLYFGPDMTFRDIDRLQPGTDFPDELNKAMAQCTIVLAIIGDQWLTAAFNGTRRLDDPNDFVRLELATALARKIPVIPVLIGRTGMPSADDLPPDLRSLAFKQKIDVPPTRAFALGMRQLVQEIGRITNLPFEDFPSVVGDCQKFGLVLLKDNFREDTTVLDEMKLSRDLMVVMNDGRGWLDQNREIIYRRLRDPDKSTRVVLIHPASPFLETLVRKSGKTRTTQIEEIRRSYEALQKQAGAGGQIEVRGHFGFNGYSLIVGSLYAFVSPYFFNESGALPLLKFASSAKQGLYHELLRDATELFTLAEPLKPEDFK